MKFIFFDVDTDVILSQGGRVRPFMTDVLEYCYESKIRVYLSGSPERVEATMQAIPESDKLVIGSFTKNSEMPHYPNLVISCNNDYLNKFPGLLIPPYDPDRSNKFAEIALAGRLLDQIKDRVVLNRYAPEKKVIQKEEPKKEPPEDPSNWSFVI